MPRTGLLRLFAGRHCFRSVTSSRNEATSDRVLLSSFSSKLYNFLFCKVYHRALIHNTSISLPIISKGVPNREKIRKETKKEEQQLVTRNPCSANRIHLYLGSFCLSPKSLSLRRRNPPVSSQRLAIDSRVDSRRGENNSPCFRLQPSSHPMPRRGRGDSGPRPPSSR